MPWFQMRQILPVNVVESQMGTKRQSNRQKKFDWIGLDLSELDWIAYIPQTPRGPRKLVNKRNEDPLPRTILICFSLSFSPKEAKTGSRRGAKIAEKGHNAFFTQVQLAIWQ
jgi:hypothetical protein